MKRHDFSISKNSDFSIPDDLTAYMDKGATSHSRLELMTRLVKKVGVSPDKFWGRKAFLQDFVTYDMEQDFPLIARDFLQHEYNNLEKYGKVVYLDTSTGEDWPRRTFCHFVLNLMFNAYMGGSEYARALFLALHRIYYNKEYKALKRFKSISAKDVFALADPDESSRSVDGNVSRIMCMAEMYGIELDQNCDFFYAILKEHLEKDEEPSFERLELDHDELMLCNKDVVDKYGHERFYEEDRYYKKFIGNVLRYYGYNPEYVELSHFKCFIPSVRMAATLLILLETYPDRKDFDENELFLFSNLFLCVGAVAGIADYTEQLRQTLSYGKDAGELYEDWESSFKPEDVKLTGNNIVNKPQADKKADASPEKQEEPKYSEKAMLKEIEDLRLEKHRLEAELKGLSQELTGRRKIEEERNTLKEELEESRKELAALRSYVYKRDAEETPEQKKSVEDMRAAIKDLRIIIVGGHPNWVAKLKREFPAWTFVSAAASGTTNTDIVDKADRVFFFTDTICHGRYYQFLNVLRERKIPFGYIHGVNIEKNIVDVYKGIKEDE